MPVSASEALEGGGDSRGALTDTDTPSVMDGPVLLN